MVEPSLLAISKAQVLQLIKIYYDKYRKILKSTKNRINNKTLKNSKFSKIKQKAIYLITVACKFVEFSLCNCEKSRNVSII